MKKQFYSQKPAYQAQSEAHSLVKKDNENVRHYALKVETLVKQVWYNEYPSTIILKRNEIFTHGLPNKSKDFANKRQVKHILRLNINMVDSEDFTLKKIKLKHFHLKLTPSPILFNKIPLFKKLLRNLYKYKL